MNGKILITGGAGFIGSHLCDLLTENGYQVRILDNLSEQVHGPWAAIPGYLPRGTEFIVGDIRDPLAVRDALKGVDAVFHFASKVGVGQSMYEIEKYTEVNNLGTAILLEELLHHPVKKLIVASSMSIYGEGMYEDPSGNQKAGCRRNIHDLRRRVWELYDQGEVLTPVPTPENKTPDLSSIYALSKYDQEKMCLITGGAYHVPTFALRFFNVYGTRQALSNPYTGVLAIFAARLLNHKAPLIFEDGQQKRDFIHVKDVAGACLAALEREEAEGQIFNVGSGHHYTITEIAHQLSQVMGISIEPEITGKYRMGDIRHCYADISKMKDQLGYTPGIDLDHGLSELAGWLQKQTAEDKVSHAGKELATCGLTI